MNNFWFSFIPKLNNKIWLLTFGRLLSQIGSGFTLFYAPIFFVNEVGLSATSVGIALGSGSISGIVGRFLGGWFTDSPAWGRRKTLLLSAAISAIADVALFFTHDLQTLILGNLLMGLGIGLYWPATEAAVADLSTPEQRNEAFAVTRLADSMGLSIGVVWGGAIIASGTDFRWLFFIDGISFVVFFGLVYVAIAETYQFKEHQNSGYRGWLIALRDRRLMVFLLVNIIITLYIAQLQSSLPLYFSNFVPRGDSGIGFSPRIISIIFSWHIIFAAITQLPVARYLNRFSRPRALIFSLLLWSMGFSLIWVTGKGIFNEAIAVAFVALSILALAMVAYTPAASALVVDLSPPELRGVYLSLNSQCWAIGYLIGPPLGGLALDQDSLVFVHGFWLMLAVSVIVGIVILLYLESLLTSTTM
ncbi:MFS transporter [Gloeocapsa sp. PCC 73106]|uniref:MFS transporter n=1 Tax=Gloeocapsa sp. PCC 73106 TaxID=102232 RepID=UPI0002AC4D66|nr:MFS transporter [Gloeocapsa sp. PCC 73106]ELR98306.1 arabinose efflux permease family protein [Gloeocapsa sp. PCC 73106]